VFGFELLVKKTAGLFQKIITRFSTKTIINRLEETIKLVYVLPM